MTSSISIKCFLENPLGIDPASCTYEKKRRMMIAADCACWPTREPRNLQCVMCDPVDLPKSGSDLEF
jgi:hypothetical protein